MQAISSALMRGSPSEAVEARIRTSDVLQLGNQCIPCPLIGC